MHDQVMGVRWVRHGGIVILLLAACSSGGESGSGPVDTTSRDGSAGVSDDDDASAAASDVAESRSYDLSAFAPLAADDGLISRTAARTTLAPLFPRPIGGEPVISDDGRKIAYFTFEPAFAGESGEGQVVVGDLLTGKIELASRGFDGEPGNGSSHRITLSADGRYAAFDSNASNLVPGDTNEAPDVFRYDTLSGSLQRVSLASGGRQLSEHSSHAAISGDGLTIAFKARGPGPDQPADSTPDCRDGPNIVVWTADGDGLECVSVTNDGLPADRISGASSVSDAPAVSYDGRFVAFTTYAPLVVDDDNGNQDIYLIDRRTGLVELVSGSDGDGIAELAAISASGRHVAFTSTSSNLVDGDTNGVADVFVYDRLADRMERISVDESGVEGDDTSGGSIGSIDISWDGRFVVFDTDATNLTDVADCPIVMNDRALSASECIAVDSDGNVAELFTRAATVSADGRLVTFASLDHTLAVGAAFDRANVYLRWREPPEPIEGWQTEVAEVSALPPTMRPLPSPIEAPDVAEPDELLDDLEVEPLVTPEWDPEARAALGEVLGPIRLPVADTDREEISYVLGPPDAFTVNFELGDEGQVMRRETWIYLDVLASYEFIDGRYVRWAPIEEPPGYAIPALAFHPLEFERWMTWETVSLMVEDPAAAVEIVVPDEVEKGVRGYASAQLLVFFDAQGLVAVESSIVTGEVS